jgi:hypothetical protein
MRRSNASLTILTLVVTSNLTSVFAQDATTPVTTSPGDASVDAIAPPSLAATAPAPPIAPTTNVQPSTAATPVIEESKPIASYFRFDQDYMFGLQLWAGATYPLTDNIALATDIYTAENYPSVSLQTDAEGTPTGAGVTHSYWGEFDIGPALTFGPVTLTPMAGIAFDWAAKRAVALNAPQLCTVVNLEKFYFESWYWTVLYSVFDKRGPNDYIHTRNWVLYKLNSTISIGPQLEYSYDLEAKRTLFGFPVGGHLELAYGSNNTLGIFLGYDTKKNTHVQPNDSAAVGRFTFVHNF